jgi:hypothetical protein
MKKGLFLCASAIVLGLLSGTIVAQDSDYHPALSDNFQAWRHVGFDLSYEYFDLSLDVDKGDWQGGAEMSYSGPIISVTANW